MVINNSEENLDILNTFTISNSGFNEKELKM